MKLNNKILIGIFALLIIGIFFISTSIYLSMNEMHHGMMGSDDLDEMHTKISGSYPGMDHGAMMAEFSKKDQKVATMPGQDAFGAIGEIVNILDQDSNTNWDKVNINGLREHLIDMDLLIKDTTVKETKLKDGLRLEISSKNKRTIGAIKRMVPTHSTMILKNIWTASTLNTKNGVILEVRDPSDFKKIQGLGFYGLMAYGGNHHQVHHLALARGEVLFK